MKNLKKHLNEKINEKIKNSFDKKDYKFYMENIEFDIIALWLISLFFTGLSLSLISLNNSSFLLIIVFLCVMFSAGLSFIVISMTYIETKEKLKVIKDIKNEKFEIEKMNNIYQDILINIFLEKKEIEILLNEIRKTGLEEIEIDYCIKMTMNQINLDLGNLFFVFLLYQNIEKFYIVKNDKYLNEKLKSQKIK